MARPRNEPAEPEAVVFRLRLKADVGVASFYSGGVAVELSDENPYFEPSDRAAYLEARQLPFMEEVE